MSNKCNFCGGDNDQPELPWCSVCNTSVSWNIARETAPKEISFEDKLTIFSNFKRWAANKENHPNYDLAFNKIKNYPTSENRELEALKKTRHNLENQIVKLNNENAKLQQDLKNASQATSEKPSAELREEGAKCVYEAICYLDKGWQFQNAGERAYWGKGFEAAYTLIGKKNAELEKKVNELETSLSKDRAEFDQWYVKLAGCGVAAQGGTKEPVIAKEGDYGWSPAYQSVLELRRKYDGLMKDREKMNKIVYFYGDFVQGSLHDSPEVTKLKQERNDWEKQASEYRFKADKLAEENAKLNLEVKDLVKKIKEYEELTDDLDEENEELCQETEDLDTEAEQYYQEAKKLNTELDKYKWPPDYHYYYGYGLRPVPKNMLYSGLYSTL